MKKRIKLRVEDCYELEGDYQNQFLGNEVFPKPKYKKLKPSKRTVNKVHYNDVYILEPNHYYYVNFNVNYKKEFEGVLYYIELSENCLLNGLISVIGENEDKLYLFNASQNVIYIQKGAPVAEVRL